MKNTRFKLKVTWLPFEIPLTPPQGESENQSSQVAAAVGMGETGSWNSVTNWLITFFSRNNVKNTKYVSRSLTRDTV